MEQPKKRFRLFDAVLAAVCIILVVEAAAPSAAIGNSQYFWWILLLIAFFLPYGLVSAELGTTYSEGGLFDWVHRAYGRKMGSRVAWYYWINFPIWMASLAVLFTTVYDQIFGTTLPAYIYLPIQLIFIWGVCILSLFSISENKVLVNVGTIFKAILMVGMGALGVYFATSHPVANPITSVRDLLPSFDGIPFIAIILFNFMGFEVVATFSGEMDNPRKQIPKALLLGGICIAVFYLFASYGIGTAIPVDKLSTSGGFMDSIGFMFEGLGISSNWLFIAIGLMVMYTLIVNLLTWALGVNYVAAHAADHAAMPAIFGKRNKKDATLGAAMVNGVMASLMVLVAPLLPNQDVFWGFFALQVITLLISYIVMFPAFKKLRRIDPDVERPFRVKGGSAMINLITYVPMILLILAAIFTITYPNGDGTWTIDWILLIGTAAAIIVGEIVVVTSGKRASTKKLEK